MTRLCDFIVIGAMKCATSTLHEQLARQDGFFMSAPKEPGFFSDDDAWARGAEWYAGLFANAAERDLCGESSTHYTKLPDYPRTVERMRETLGEHVRFIYVMRDPIDRLVSHYVHEWAHRAISWPLDEAVQRHPALVEYGRYARQLDPYLDAFGRQRVLPVFFERLAAAPNETLAAIGSFLGRDGLQWREDVDAHNPAGHRQRLPGIVDTITDLPGMTALRRTLLPERLRRRLTRRWRLPERPELSPDARREVAAVFDEDLAVLGRKLGLELTCANFREVAAVTKATWTEASEHAA